MGGGDHPRAMPGSDPARRAGKGNGPLNALSRVTRWKGFFASWQLGSSRPEHDGEYRAVADHRAATISTRTDLDALINLLISRRVITAESLAGAREQAADTLSAAFASQYPGWEARDSELHMEFPAAGNTMNELGFPP